MGGLVTAGTLAAERVVDSVGSNHEAAAEKRQEHFRRMGRKQIPPPSRSNQAGKACDHQNQDAPAAMSAKAVGQRNCSQQRDYQSQEAMRALFRWQEMNRDDGKREEHGRQNAVDKTSRRSPDSQFIRGNGEHDSPPSC